MADNTKLPAAVIRQLSAARGMLRKYVCIQAILMIVCWLLVVFWVGALFDYLPVQAGSNETPRWVRIGLLAAMAVGSLWIIVRWAMPRLLARIEDRSLALLIERHYPELNNELVTAVELSQRSSEADLDSSVENAAAHQSMLSRVYRSVGKKVDRVSLSQLFNWQPVWATGTAAVFGLLITGITAIGMTEWLSLWSQRLFGLSDQPWPRVAELRADGVLIQFPTFTGQLSAQRAMLAFDEGIARIPSGAAVMLQISANANDKQVPEVCTMFYRSADGSRGRANLRRLGSPRDGWQQFTLDGPPLDGISQPMELDVVGLDARLRDLRLEVVEPCIVTNMQLECVYPKYLQDTYSSRPAREMLAYRAGIRIPEGTVVTLNGSSSSPLSKVEYVVRKTNEGTEAGSAEESGVQSDVTIASVIPEGNQFVIPLDDLRQSQVIELRLIDQYGLSSDQILRYVLTTLEDLSPEVETRLVGIGTAVTPNALLPIRGSVLDDFGIANVFVEIALDEQQLQSLPIQPSEDGTIESDIDLEKLAAQGASISPGMTLGMVVSATDYFDLDGQQHTGRGQPQQLAVVSADQLLVILDRQELELRQRLELIISELQQVNEVLRQLGSDLQSSESAARLAPVGPQFVSAAVQEASATNQTDDQALQSATDARAQLRRMAVLRAQQSILQCDKSEQELLGIANRVDNIRRQLLNNRIDSYDRQNRLESKVHAPLIQLLDSEYQTFSSGLDELQTATMSGSGFQQTQASLSELARVLDVLDGIKSNMLDIESFNEIVDLVRSLLEDQEGILSETEKQQKARILDLLKGN